MGPQPSSARQQFSLSGSSRPTGSSHEFSRFRCYKTNCYRRRASCKLEPNHDRKRIFAVTIYNVKLNAKMPLLKAFPRKLETVSNHIRTIRLRRGLERSQVADIFGVTECTVSNWENHRNSLRVPQCGRIIEYLRYNPIFSQQTFPEELISFRRLRGLRVKDATALAGVDPCSWTSWENGEHQITKPCREKIDRLLRQGADA